MIGHYTTDVNAVESGQRLDVIEWRNSPPTLLPKKQARRIFIPPAYFGVLGTVLLHGLAIHSLPIGQSSRTKPPEAQEPAAARSGSKVDESLVLLTLPATAGSDQFAASNPAWPQFSDKKLKMMAVAAIAPPILPSLTLPLSEDQSSKPAEGRGDAAEQAQLFGLYTGQIQARIERVWRRPRSPVNESNTTATASVAESFQCQVQIVQDLHGNVQEVLLLACNGSHEWQRSLVVAIQQASPLPAPPSETVFNQSVTLNFLGLQFAPGSPGDEYELPPRNFAQAAQ
jgi:hypothetical protein